MKKNLTTQPEPLAGLSVFRVVARLQSFTRAGNQLGVSASAVSQSVRALESRLGVRLFQRTSRQVSLSEAGRDLLARIDSSLDHIEIALQQTRDGRGQPSGLLRLNLSQLAADLLVVPRLTAFLDLYPRVQVELFIDNTLSDLVAGHFDAGIRLGGTLAQEMIARAIGGDQQRVVVAAPDYLQRRGVPRTPADLAEHDCIRFRLPGSGRLEAWAFVENGQTLQLQVEGRLICTDDRLVREAVRNGLGLSRQFRQSVKTDIEAGRLVEVLQGYAPPQPCFYVYFPARELMAPKLRAFIDFFCASSPG